MFFFSLFFWGGGKEICLGVFLIFGKAGKGSVWGEMLKESERMRDRMNGGKKAEGRVTQHLKLVARLKPISTRWAYIYMQI